MRHTIRLFTLAALATATFALPAPAQQPAATPAAANPCESNERAELYTKYYNEKKVPATQKNAFETGKQYLEKYESCNDQYSTAVRKFVKAYEEALAGANLQNDFVKAFDAKDWAKAFDLGKQLMAKDPEDVRTAVLTSWAGYSAVSGGNQALNADALAVITKTVGMIEGGKTAANWGVFKSKDDALGWLNFTLGALNLKSNPKEAAGYLVKAAQSDSTAKSEPSTYSYLAFAYEKGEWEPLVAKYKTFTEVNDESRMLLANINLVVDRMIDAYARAIAFAGNDATAQKNKAEWTRILTDLYKSRHNNSDAGLTELLANVKNTPLLQTTPVTTPPPVETTGTPATNNTSGAATTGTGANGPAAKPAASPTPTPTPTPATKPPAQENTVNKNRKP